MFSNQVEKIYTIELPISTSQDIIEWFEIMAASNRLPEELIHLVYDHIRSENFFHSIAFQSDIHNEINDQKAEPAMDQDDFFNSLYNWQDGNSQIFAEPEPKIEKKIKKKMLSV